MLKVFLMVILFLLTISLQYRFWQSDYQEYQTLQQKVAKQTQANAALKARNDALAAEVADLKQGLEAIEERARLELGMIKQDEVFYQIVE